MDEELKAAFVEYRKARNELATILKNSRMALETTNKSLDELHEAFVKAENVLKEPGERHDRILEVFQDFWVRFGSDDPTIMTHGRALKEYMNALQRHEERYGDMKGRLARATRPDWAKDY